MTNPDHPTMSLAAAPNRDVAKVAVEFLGLTKREYFAAMAMQGFACAQQLSRANPVGAWCKYAVEWADHLITELNK